MKSRWVSLVFLAAFVPRAVVAQVPGPVSLPVPLVNQDTMVWCWMAVAEMALRFKGVQPPRQCEIMEIGYRAPPGSCCGNPAACTRPGHITEIQSIIARFGGGLATMVPPTDPMTMYSVIARGDAIIAHLSLPQGGHFVVLRGMRFAPTGQGIVPLVLINDPMQMRPFELPFINLMQVWDVGLLVRGALAQPGGNGGGMGGGEDDGPSGTGRWRFDYRIGQLKRTSGGDLDEASCEAARERKKRVATWMGPCRQGSFAGEEELEKNDGCRDECSSDHDRCVADVDSFEDCMDEKPEACVDACMNGYGYDYRTCVVRMCRPDDPNNQASWGGSCQRVVKAAGRKCESARDRCLGNCD